MIKWFKKLNMIVSTYGQLIQEVENVQTEMERALHYVKKATKIHVDVALGPKDPSTIIACGRYRGKDYVHVFRIHSKDLAHLIDQLRYMQKHAEIGYIDAPFAIDATIKRELGL